VCVCVCVHCSPRPQTTQYAGRTLKRADKLDIVAVATQQQPSVDC